ncbi:hypothetical protein NHP20013_13660 [Helicobacter bizzozeronii]|nr:hypothetical protein NHP20013_13660 [Helicobacter bizzozeronii]
MAFKPFRVAQMLDTEERRLSYLNAVLRDGDMVELKDAIEVIAESKGVELPVLEGDFGLLPALKKLGFKLQALELPKTHTV